jgi:hypothetical protein
MDVRSGLRTAGRVVLAAVAYLICFVLAYGLAMPAVPPDPSAAASPLSAGEAVLLMAALHTGVMSWLILRSPLSGARLAVTMTAVFFGVQTLLPQVESWIFQAFPRFAAHLPAGMVPRIVLAGLIHACLWIPLAVKILGRWRRGTGRETEPLAPLGWRLPLAAAAYVIVYFVFGYYVAWRSPAVVAYYGGSDPGSFWLQIGSVLRETPWLPLAQAVRGLLWTAIGLIVLRSLRGSLLEKALAVGVLFSVVMDAGLLLPNPYMPYAVRMVHLVETGTSNFLFGLLVAWVFAPARADVRPRPG